MNQMTCILVIIPEQAGLGACASARFELEYAKRVCAPIDRFSTISPIKCCAPLIFAVTLVVDIPLAAGPRHDKWCRTSRTIASWRTDSRFRIGELYP